MVIRTSGRVRGKGKEERRRKGGKDESELIS